MNHKIDDQYMNWIRLEDLLDSTSENFREKTGREVGCRTVVSKETLLETWNEEMLPGCLRKGHVLY